ncbi:ATP-binding protein [Streptomyces sp. LP05-1]|uniref:ATP-binding protein n=1 Tax=Streptomyces pyxinae TaxID=2970734 RepID=A0ABT2CPZ0_9ACTN|nr:ATP-binding protein [Streptomyces sp. LP05-1]MCS0639503.1 ATP-binding protein [Streptomyces sp. LP05-1]
MAHSPAPLGDLTVRVFSKRFSPTPSGARLARRICVQRLHSWCLPLGNEICDRVALIVAELAANAVTHGKVPGREFEVRLSLTPHLVRIEVTDARGECRPPGPGQVPSPVPDACSGRGMLLVEALASRWEVRDGRPVGKTVVAEVELRVGLDEPQTDLDELIEPVAAGELGPAVPGADAGARGRARSGTGPGRR